MQTAICASHGQLAPKRKKVLSYTSSSSSRTQSGSHTAPRGRGEWEEGQEGRSVSGNLLLVEIRKKRNKLSASTSLNKLPSAYFLLTACSLALLGPPLVVTALLKASGETVSPVITQDHTLLSAPFYPTGASKQLCFALCKRPLSMPDLTFTNISLSFCYYLGVSRMFTEEYGI